MEYVAPTPISAETEARVLAHYGCEAGPLQHQPGTASSSAVVATPQGPLFLRRRRKEYSDENVLRHDHALLHHLHNSGFPCTPPLRTVAGPTWATVEGELYEAFEFVPGEPYDPASADQVREVGWTVGRLHELTSDWQPPAPKPWLREDDPRLLREPLQELTAQAEGDDCSALLQAAELLEDVASHLPPQMYEALPQAVVHGDVHPGNVLFRDGRVVGLFDWDWTSRQARVRDLCDGLLFFAAAREQRIEPSDIRSLTQSWRLEPSRAAGVAAGYSTFHQLCDAERDACFWLLCSRWLQSRIRGARKVKVGERVHFVIRGLFEPVEHLRREWPQIAGALHGARGAGVTPSEPGCRARSPFRAPLGGAGDREPTLQPPAGES